jgi:transposase
MLKDTLKTPDISTKKTLTIEEKEDLIKLIAKLEQSNRALEQSNQTLTSELLLAKEKEATIQLKYELIQLEYEQMMHLFLQAQRDRFGRKRERFVDEDESEQISLFEDSLDSTPEEEGDGASVGCDSDGEVAEEDIEIIAYKRKPSNQKKTNKSVIATREVIIPVEEADLHCECGCERVVIGYDKRNRLNYQPAVFEMLIEKREKRACKKGCEWKNVVKIAALTPSVLPKCRASESLLSYLAISKVLDRQPLYHLEKSIDQRYHWNIPRQTMARWMIQLSQKLQPLVNLMKEELIGYDVSAIDATALQVLNEPNRNPQTKSYVYCIRGGPPKKEVIIYEYNGYTQKEYVKETLTGFQGVIMCDAGAVFNGIGAQEGVSLSYCNAHARRKFEQIEKINRGYKKGKGTLAKEAMKFYQELYKVEREATVYEMSPEQRFELRQKKSKPILEALDVWLRLNEANTLPKTPIGQAIAYARNHWEGLSRYISDGRLEIDNNATEREIKPFVMARKNFLFSATIEGADSLGIHFSLILTAKRHGLNPFAYYEAVLKQIPLCKTIQDYEALLPWNIQLP